MLIAWNQSVDIVYYDIFIIFSWPAPGSPYTSPSPLNCLKLCLKFFIFIYTNQTCYCQQWIDKQVTNHVTCHKQFLTVSQLPWLFQVYKIPIQFQVFQVCGNPKYVIISPISFPLFTSQSRDVGLRNLSVPFLSWSYSCQPQSRLNPATFTPAVIPFQQSHCR